MSQINPFTASIPSPPHTTLPPAPDASRDPYRVFGIVGFVLSLFAILNMAGLIISIIAWVRSRRAGFKNRFAVAGTVIGSIGVLVTVVIAGVAGSALVDAAQTCARLGTGVHVIGSSTYTCTPTSFYVSVGAQPPASSPADPEWADANAHYFDAICPTNAAREALYAAIDTENIGRLAPVAASASDDFAGAATVFLNHTWPAAIEEDIRLLGETSEQLSDSWAAVAAATDMDAANAVPFPEAQSSFEASQRIRATLVEHGQQAPEC